MKKKPIFYAVIDRQKMPIIKMLDLDGDETDDPFMAEMAWADAGDGAVCIFEPKEGDIMRDIHGK